MGTDGPSVSVPAICVGDLDEVPGCRPQSCLGTIVGIWGVWSSGWELSLSFYLSNKTFLKANSEVLEQGVDQGSKSVSGNSTPDSEPGRRTGGGTGPCSRRVPSQLGNRNFIVDF